MTRTISDFWCKNYNYWSQAWSNRNCDYYIWDTWTNACCAVSYSSVCNEWDRDYLNFWERYYLLILPSWFGNIHAISRWINCQDCSISGILCIHVSFLLLFFFFSNYFMVSWTEFNMVLTACPSNLIQQLRIDLWGLEIGRIGFCAWT